MSRVPIKPFVSGNTHFQCGLETLEDGLLHDFCLYSMCTCNDSDVVILQQWAYRVKSTFAVNDSGLENLEHL